MRDDYENFVGHSARTLPSHQPRKPGLPSAIASANCEFHANSVATSAALAQFEHLICCGGCEHLHTTGNNTRPALVTGAKFRPIVTVEILVEQDKITPGRVFLELPRSTINRPPTPTLVGS